MGFKELMTRLLDLFCRHRGKTLGLLIGLIISILSLTIGGLKTLFIVGCCLLGLIIGGKIDNHEDLRNIISRILPPHD